ncbi:hypothetical protein N431DRAFT_115778 [Stipitochalara longipes BDJ]|nr:hypothetical protein N431DRAFT_115778 [Stipitochalara longipes BDJ]
MPTRSASTSTEDPCPHITDHSRASIWTAPAISASRSRRGHRQGFPRSTTSVLRIRSWSSIAPQGLVLSVLLLSRRFAGRCRVADFQKSSPCCFQLNSVKGPQICTALLLLKITACAEQHKAQKVSTPENIKLLQA